MENFDTKYLLCCHEKKRKKWSRRAKKSKLDTAKYLRQLADYYLDKPLPWEEV